MKAKMRKPKEKFCPIDITLEKKEEAEALWAFLNLPGDSLRRIFREEYADIPNKEELVDVTFDMFQTLDDEFTPRWNDKERKD